MYSFRFVADYRNTEIIFERVKTSSYSLDFSDSRIISSSSE